MLAQLTNVCKSYKNKQILKNINLTINRGDRIAIVGPNGNGKTTMCEILAGLRPVDSGQVTYCNPDIVIGMQLQEAKFSKGITGWDLCQFYLKFYGKKFPLQYLEYLFTQLQIASFINKPLVNLSGGQQQRINILLALIHQPELIILDELGTGLDLESKHTIYQYVESQLNANNSLVLVTHTMQEVEMFCTDLVFVHQGEIINRVKVKDIIDEYGDVETYVRKQFKEYQVGVQKEGLNLGLQGDHKNELWKKEWSKELKNK